MTACILRRGLARAACILVVSLGTVLASAVPSRAQCAPEPDGATCLEAVDESPLGQRIPLVLVHGWNRDSIPAPPQGEVWDPFIQYYSARPALFANFKLYRLLYWSNSAAVDLGMLGLDLRDTLDNFSAADPDAFGRKPIVIVAHSMGGLISRDYMTHVTQQGAFAGRPGADRVLRLITLATPHHGSMAANGAAVVKAAAGPVWWTPVDLFNAYFYLTGSPSSNQHNRSDLHWDNYDNLLDYNDPSHAGEANEWLVRLNADASHDKHIIAYAGVIAPSASLDAYSLGATFIQGAFDMPSDGVVPRSSAFFHDGSGFPRTLLTRPWPGYDHSELPRSKGDWALFHQLEADLLSALPSILPATGLITTVAGGGPGGIGGLATEANFWFTTSVAVDRSGDLYVADGNQVYKVTRANGLISAVAGGGITLGDDGPATSAKLYGADGLAVDGQGNVYIADTLHHRIRKVTASTGIITTVAGTGSSGFNGDGGAATEAQLSRPDGVAVDADGNLYVADTLNDRVRKVTHATGLISTVAGTGTGGFSGDGGLATAAQLDDPYDVALDDSGNLYIADYLNNRIRKVSAATGVISTVAGGTNTLGDGGPATEAKTYHPRAVTVDRAGNLYIAADQRVRKVSAATGVIATVAGNGTLGGARGDGGPATAADLGTPWGVAVDATGNLFIASYLDLRVRMVVLDTTLAAATAARGDFTDDVKSDILWRHATQGDIWLWPMDGAARTTESAIVRTLPDPDWEIRGLGDQTGDGKADILWRNKVSGQVYLWPMNGSTPVDEIYVATVDPAYDIVGTGDFNGDGKSDILWRHTTLGDVWVWLMDGATPLSQVYVDRVDPGYVVKGVGDVDANGKADIVWHHATTGEVWVWPMNGTTRLDQVWVGTVPDTGYQIQGVADFTGDGKADLLWWHATRGEVWIWTMDGTIRASGDLGGDGAGDGLPHRGDGRLQRGYESRHPVAPRHAG